MAINRDEPSRLTYPLGNSATVATLPQTSDTVASTSGLFPYLTQVPVAQGGAYPRREDINALIKALADPVFFSQSGHVWSYSGDFLAQYKAGDVVWYEVDADLYATFTVGGVAQSVVVAPAGQCPMLFIRNSTAYTTGAGTPTVTQNGHLEVNSAYWMLAISDVQYGQLLQSIYTASQANYATDAEVYALVTGQPRPYILIDSSLLADSTGGTVYAYITVEGTPAETYPGMALPYVTDTLSLLVGWPVVSLTTLNPSASVTVTLSCGEYATAAIDWDDLKDARGKIARVRASSSTFDILDLFNYDLTGD